MRHTLLGAIAAAAAAASPAFAQQNDSYWSVNLGAAFPPDQNLGGDFTDDGGTTSSFSGEVEFDPGFFGSVVWGKTFAPINRSGLGVEVEGFYQALNPDNFTFGGLDLDPNVTDEEEFFAGNASIFGGLVNGVYHVRSDSPWSAKVGGGVGYGRLSYDIEEAFDDGDGVLVYQAFAGLGYQLAENLEAELTGRYFGASDTEFADDGFFAQSQLDAYVTTVGLTWHY
ncbi:MAG: outer membrane protein [Amphiplicatus sp.]